TSTSKRAEGVHLGTGTRAAGGNERRQRVRIDGDGKVRADPCPLLRHATVQIGAADVHQCASASLRRSTLIVSRGDSGGSAERLVDDMTVLGDQPPAQIGAVEHLGEEQLLTRSFLAPA